MEEVPTNALITKDEITIQIRWYIRRNFLSLKDAAKHYGWSAAYLSGIQCGEKPPNKKLLSDMGYEKVDRYLKVN